MHIDLLMKEKIATDIEKYKDNLNKGTEIQMFNQQDKGEEIKQDSELLSGNDENLKL